MSSFSGVSLSTTSLGKTQHVDLYKSILTTKHQMRVKHHFTIHICYLKALSLIKGAICKNFGSKNRM